MSDELILIVCFAQRTLETGAHLSAREGTLNTILKRVRRKEESLPNSDAISDFEFGDFGAHADDPPSDFMTRNYGLFSAQ